MRRYFRKISSKMAHQHPESIVMVSSVNLRVAQQQSDTIDGGH